jgi:predicted TIM-barrel fold metal-dependent hydrolase
MNAEIERRSQVAREGVIDCDIHPLMRSASHLKTYLVREWHEYYDAYGSFTRGEAFVGANNYPEAAPLLSRRDSYPKNGGPPGSDLEFMQEQFLDPFGVEYGVLQVLAPNGGNQRNVHFGAAVCSAVNEWQLAEWTSRDSRLKGSILVAQEFPETAIAEIELRAKDPSFVQVMFNQRTLEPMGRQRYRGIIAAAVAHDLPIGVHSGGRNGQPALPGGGWPSYTAEQQTLSVTAMQSLVTSLVLEGVFEEFPQLRVALIEGGFTWLPPLMWRLDRLWKRWRPELPHVRRPPSEYIREHCWLSTQPMEHGDDTRYLREVFDHIGWDRLCYASDYPHWDFDDPRYAFPLSMSGEERRKITYDNAKNLFRL